MEKNLASSAIVGSSVSVGIFIFQFAVQFATQFIFTIYLTPEEYGVYALSLTLVLFISSLSYLQADKYLINVKSDVIKQFNIVFTMQIVVVSCVFLIALLLLPLVLTYLNKQEYIESSLLLLSIIFYNPFGVFRIMLEKDLKFIKAKLPGLVSQIIALIIGVSLAYLGYGVYALVCWKVSQMFIEVLIIIILVGQIPKWSFNRKDAKEILNFSFPVFLSGLIIFFYYNIDYLIIDFLLTKKELGYYFFAFQISSFVLRFRSVISSVLFPIYSKIEDIAIRRKWFLTVSNILLMCYLFPTILIVLFGEDLLTLVLNEKWVGAIVPLKIMMIASVLRGVFGNATPYLYSLKITRNDIWLGILNAIFIPTMVLVGGLLFNLIGACFGLVAGATIAIFIGTDFINKKYTQVSFWELNKKGILIIIFLVIWILNQVYIGIELNILITFFAFIALITLFFYLFINDLKLLYKKLVKSNLG